MPAPDLDLLRKDIGNGVLNNWPAIHERYDELWERYRTEKQKHAFAVLTWLHGDRIPNLDEWKSDLGKTVGLQEYVSRQVYESRKKDFDNPFRQTTFRNKEEMKATLGTVDDNGFILQVRQETNELIREAEQLMQRFRQ
jgi:hypothetical protein